MEKNIGTFDKIIRVVIALVLATVTYGYGIDWGVWSWVAYAVAVYLIVTVMAGHCLLYALLGINTYLGQREKELQMEMEAKVAGGKRGKVVGKGGRKGGVVGKKVAKKTIKKAKSKKVGKSKAKKGKK